MPNETSDNKISSLKRSLTARHIPSLTIKKASSRTRASSFTSRFRQPSPLTTTANTSAINISNNNNNNIPQPTPLCPSPFLTVDDDTGGPSSIESESDEDNDNNQQQHPITLKEKQPERPVTNASSPSLQSRPHSLEKKLSTTFKEKLSLSRRSTKKISGSRYSNQHGFHLWKSRQKETDLQQPKLYDDAQGPYPPAPTVDPNRRDQYGFTRSIQWISIEEYDAFEEQYHAITHRRSQKWRDLLDENNGEWPQRTSKFKRYIRKGIPPEFRRQAWLHYSGGEEKMRNQAGLYQQCVRKAMELGTNSEHLDIIERDLHRTFPDNINFKPLTSTTDNEAPTIQALRRLLYAFSVYSPSIGYCQSLNYIAGLLLLFMTEEEAFWTLVALIHDILPPNVYDITMEGASIDQDILMLLLSERCPLIWQRLSGGASFWECEQNGMPTSSLVTSHWFLTLFINILPTESVLRVWDCLFYEGRRALIRVALAVFKLNEPEILGVKDPLQVFQVVQNMPKRMLDCHQLLDATFYKYASITRISDQDLEKKRHMFKARRDQRRNKASTTTSGLKRNGVAGTILFKAKERLVERAKTVRHK